jgi:hypothetical protein
MRIRLLATILFSVTIATRAEAQFNVANPAPAENFHVEIGLMFWQPTPGIEIQTGGLAVAGIPAVDFVQEFGLADERFMEFRSVFKTGRKHKFRVSHITFDYNETAPITRNIDFGGVTFPITIPVTADLNWDMWRFGYEYDFVAGDRGLLGFITELKQNHLTADLSAAGLNISQGADVTAPIINIGVIARVYPHRVFSITAEYTGFKVFGFVRTLTDRIAEDLEANVSDFDIYGTVNFGRHVGAQVGYRSLTSDYSIDEDEGDLKMKGMYFGGLVRF